MADSFIMQDLYVPRHKTLLKTIVSPLKCHICNRALNGISITARIIDGKAVFLCPAHLKASPKAGYTSG